MPSILDRVKRRLHSGRSPNIKSQPLAAESLREATIRALAGNPYPSRPDCFALLAHSLLKQK